jgi:hypothetical protein
MRPQGRVACAAGVIEYCGKIEAFCAGVTDQLAGKGIIERLTVAITGDPPSRYIVFELGHSIQSFE